MPVFTALVPETFRNVSPGYVETLLQARREELFTGLICLRYAAGENLVSTFLEGAQQKLYRCLENTIEVIPRHMWLNPFNHSNAAVGFLRMPVEALRFTRAAYEAPVLRQEKSILTWEGLRETAVKWAAEVDPAIVCLQGETINRFYLIAGHASPIIEELSLVEDEARFSIGDASFPLTLPRAEYQIVRYVSYHEHEIWREYELRLAFNPLMRMLLNRFGELAGHMLTERLCKQLSLWARESGWNLTITSNGVVNRHYFDTLESAIGTYSDLFRRFRQEANPALGLRMVDSISREVLMKLDPYSRELLSQYIYSQYVIGGMAGVVQR